MEPYMATNSSGQYMVVDQNLGQRYPVNNAKGLPYFVGGPASSSQQPPPQSVSLNLLSGNSLYTNQLNSSLNNVGLNTHPPPSHQPSPSSMQQDKSKQPTGQFHPSHLGNSFPNHPGISIESESLKNQIREFEKNELNSQFMNNAKLLSRRDLNNPTSIAIMNHFERTQYKPNSIGAFAPNQLLSLNNESPNGHSSFLHHLQIQPQQQHTLLNNKPSRHTIPMNQPQMPINFNNSTNSNQAPPPSNQQLYPNQLHHHPNYPFVPHHQQQLDKEKLNLSLNKSHASGNLYMMNSPINLNNKKPKLNNNPLKVDTSYYNEMKPDGGYNPQVEAISPTNQDDKNDDSSLKDKILRNLDKVDGVIKQTEGSISKLKRKQRELETSTTNLSPQNQTENLDPNNLKQLSTTQLIYTENKKRADESQRKLDKINPLTIAPLYNQPSDLPFYFENKKKFKWFKPKLVMYFKKRLLYKQKREKYLTSSYEKLMNHWLENVECKRTNGMLGSKFAKMRHNFEKQFVELKKAREEKQNKEVALQDEYDDNVEEYNKRVEAEEATDIKRMRSLAVIPPILLDHKLRKYKFINNNGLVHDPISEHKELQYLNTWKDTEKAIFKEKYLLSPKNFTLIASCLENKTVADCVQYYYSSKKSENYKQLLRKNAKKRTRALAKQQALDEQKAKQELEIQQQKELFNNQSSKSVMVNGINLSIKPNATDQNESDKKSSSDDVVIKDEEEAPATTASDDQMAIVAEDTNKADCKENLDKNIEINNNTLRCCLCKVQIENITKSYAITKFNYHLFNINLEDLQPDYRVCLPCKARYSKGSCSVNWCKYFGPDNQVRLKPLPIEWFELSPEQRYTYSAELNFPVDCRHCCSSCWILLIRKYGRILKYPLEKYLTCSWTPNEIENFKELIYRHGRNWSFISSLLKTKSVKQCKDFYFYFKYQLKLNDLARMASFGNNKQENDLNSDDDFDADFNDLESDSESLDDLRLARRNSTSRSRRTNSFLGADGLLSLSKRHSSSNLSLKSDCDSCATLSADENESDVQMTDTRRLEPLFPTTSLNRQQAPSLQAIQRIPSFLIDQNAPTPLKPNQPEPRDNSNVQTTCVRELIYRAIDMTLNSPEKGAVNSPADISTVVPKMPFNNSSQPKVPSPLSTVSKLSQPVMNQSVKSNYDQMGNQLARMSPYSTSPHSQISHAMKPSDFHQLSSLQLQQIANARAAASQPLNLKATAPYNHMVVDNYADEEVQDLSKKSAKKDTYTSNDYDQPKNLSLKPAHTKSNTDTYLSSSLNLNSGQLNHQMPPPAHMHPHRTLTPGPDVVNDLSRRGRESPHKMKPVINPYQQQQAQINMLCRLPMPNQLNQMQQMRITPNSRSTPNPRSTPNSMAAARLTPTNLPPNHKNSPSPHHLNQPQQPLTMKPLSMNNSFQQQFTQQQQKSSINQPSPLTAKQQQEARQMFISSPIGGGSIVHGMPAVIPQHHQSQAQSQNKPFYHHSNSPSPIQLQAANLIKNEALMRPMSAQPSMSNSIAAANLHQQELNALHINQINQMNFQMMNDENLFRSLNNANAAAAASAELNYLHKNPAVENSSNDRLQNIEGDAQSNREPE